MKNFFESLSESNEAVKSVLRENKEIAEHPYHKRDETLMSILYSLKEKYKDEFNYWINQKQLDKIQAGIATHLVINNFSFSIGQGLIHLKHGVLSLGSFPYRNIHITLQEYGVSECECGYYILVLYMIERPRLELFNVDHILNKINNSKKH
jgi:hypothetical protein